MLTALAGLLAAANAFGVVVLLVDARWMEAALGVLSVVTAYWFAMGAWRRTPWGRVSADNAPSAPPVLSPRRARVYVLTGAACVGALALALGLQAFVLSR